MTDLRLLTLNDVEDALGYITQYDDRDLWVRMAMSLKSEFGDAGFDVWNIWSQQSDSYKAADARAVWKSVKESGNVGIGSLIKLAQDAGFKFSVKEIPAEERERRKQVAIERRAENKRRRAQAEAERKNNHQVAAQRAADIWKQLPTEGFSPYLSRKKINGFGCRYGKNNSIAIPLYKNKKITGLQWIDADGNKKFLTGTEKSGACFTIPGETDTTVLCEGFATGASIHTATGYQVIVTFDADNMISVFDRLADQLTGKVIIAADNDHAKKINKGLQVAHKIAEQHSNASIIWPPAAEGVTDFNDVYVAQGAGAVKTIINTGEPQAYPANFAKPAVQQTAPNDEWLADIIRSDGGAPKQLSSNVALILQNHPLWKGSLAYCDFSYKIIKTRASLPDMSAGEWDDADSALLAVWLSVTFGFEPSRSKLNDGLVVAAKRNRMHPVRDYLRSLKWDGTERIENWLEDVYEASADNMAYLRAVGSKFLIGAVARIMKPGCKMDNVMILEGRQGLRKSTSLSVLFGEWFSDAPIPIGEKDAYQNIQGVWCSELAELDSFNKAESTSAKLFFSQVRDRYRPSYGQHAQDFPRQTIFVGTTNQSEYLKDYTGNRRYWPVQCATAKIDIIKENRDQLWAEAMHRYQAGASWWADDESRDVFENEQDNRMQLDPWHYPIEDYLARSVKPYYTADDVLQYAIEKDLAQITRADQNRISPIMKKLGYTNVKKRILVGSKKMPRHVYIEDKSGE